MLRSRSKRGTAEGREASRELGIRNKITWEPRQFAYDQCSLFPDEFPLCLGKLGGKTAFKGKGYHVQNLPAAEAERSKLRADLCTWLLREPTYHFIEKEVAESWAIAVIPAGVRRRSELDDTELPCITFLPYFLAASGGGFPSSHPASFRVPQGGKEGDSLDAPPPKEGDSLDAQPPKRRRVGEEEGLPPSLPRSLPLLVSSSPSLPLLPLLPLFLARASLPRSLAPALPRSLTCSFPPSLARS